MSERATPKPSDISREFWTATQRGEFLVQHDAASGRSQFYPRPGNLFGESPTTSKPASGLGILIAVTTVRTPVPGLESPYLVGIVRLDEGPRVFARLLNAESDIAPGQKMKLVWEAGEGETRLYAFEPA
jgi:uncharacterized OB-fold protein